jgi:hypothetical protein
MLQDEANASAEVAHYASFYLNDCLNWETCLAMRTFYMEKCVDNIVQHKSVARTVSALVAIIRKSFFLALYFFTSPLTYFLLLFLCFQYFKVLTTGLMIRVRQ